MTVLINPWLKEKQSRKNVTEVKKTKDSNRTVLQQTVTKIEGENISRKTTTINMDVQHVRIEFTYTLDKLRTQELSRERDERSSERKREINISW